jgi:4'-phosphopantetheinyl transferase
LFKFQKGRDHFIVGRATLRRLLGNALKLDPAALTFSYGPRGKPELAGAAAGQLHFNVSHSGGLALVALTRRCPVGVDIEHDRPSTMGTEIAERFFTQRENAGLMQLPEARRAAAFINLWTRKEAWLKATGDGIATWLKRVEVSFLPGEPARVLAVDDLPEEPACWTLADLRPATGYSGAMAIRAHDLNVRCWRWVE